MNHSQRSLLFLAIIAIIVIFVATLLARGEDKTPKLTDAQKLEIRNAQVEFFTAKAQLEATPQYQNMTAAQTKLTDAVQKAMKEAGADQAKYQLQNDLSLVELNRPPEQKVPKK